MDLLKAVQQQWEDGREELLTSADDFLPIGGASGKTAAAGGDPAQTAVEHFKQMSTGSLGALAGRPNSPRPITAVFVKLV